MSRIISSIENRYISEGFSRDYLADMVGLLSKDSLFCEMARDACLCGMRKHVRKSVGLILGGRVKSLGLYWRFCAIVRKIRYGKQTA